MRADEFELRAWDGTTMYYANLLDFISIARDNSQQWPHIKGFCGQYKQPRSRMDYMLLCSLPVGDDDENSVYANDIMECTATHLPGGGYRTIVLYFEGSFYTSHDGKPNELLTQQHIDEAHLIVIGNIYETPHLIPEEERGILD